MNQKEWKQSLKYEGKYYYRNLAVKHFSLTKGHVIHHLRDTKEQRIFNDTYYERWGFDFNGKMKYCVKLTKEKHIEIHSVSEETRKNISKALKGKYVGEDAFRHGIKLSNEHRKRLSEVNKGKKITEEHKEIFKKFDDR